MEHILEWEEFNTNFYLNESKIDFDKLNGVNGDILKGIYERLCKPTPIGKKIKVLIKNSLGNDSGIINNIIVTKNISNDAKIFYKNANIGYYEHNEYLFIKDLGLFPINEGNTDKSDYPEKFKNILDKLPKEYHQYLNLKK